ncbi:AAA domain-containing protein [Desulfosporosinus meridiei]|uniref:DNA/RNA helicase, superfamily I n=1 Tax=Desulfosporosinus meridiei (strain ATCC BAA-275 / DSM 13257 / KCTC 12902 / NCIMB 13706 / S10) TaxID=768704 RepID=J7IQJ1_DESMD|nr:AAA domain-containing protein [Desulfosporosinus meridiei]AFQ42439.1 Protein of unknown function (DUF559) [Desulfosporosinus meridiei DSM 13257]
MEKTLQKLKDRLSDLSKRNRSLRLLKLYDKWTFDLAQLNSKEILDKLIHSQGPIYLVSNQSSDEKEQRLAHRLQSLYRNVTALEEETGSYNVYVGYPFLTGRFPDDTYIQAPVFLFPVRLEKRTDRSPGWVLIVDSNDDITINKTLLLAMRKYAQISVDEQINDDAKQIPQSGFADWTCRLFNKYGVKCSMNSDKLAPLPQFTQKEIPNCPKGNLEIKEHLVLGHFPQSNSALLKDYEDLVGIYQESGELGLVNDILLETEEDSSQTEGVWDEPIDLDLVPQAKTFNILDLDASQEEVIHSAEMQKGIVVHGPPGTGKSQVIVNLISNAMAKEKKVLVVCQKRAALSVVYQRLDALSLTTQVALVHDAAMDRKNLYFKISNIMDNQFISQTRQEESEYENLSQELDQKTKYLNKIASGLWTKQKCGLTAFELYTRSKSLKTNEILLNLGSIPEKVDYTHMLKLLPMIKRLGNYFGKFGHEGYSWVDRQSFARMENATLYELRQMLNKVIGQAEVAANQKILNGGFNPSDCWANEETLSKGIRFIERYNQKAILSNISLWFWTKFSGKDILAKLSNDAASVGFKSEQWKEIEKAIVDIYKFGTDTQTLNASLEVLGRFLKPNVISRLNQSLSKGDIPLDFLQKLQKDLDNDFDELEEMDSIIAQLNDIESDVLAILLRELPVIPNPTLGDLWQGIVEKSFYTRWVDECEKACPEIKQLSAGKFDEVLNEYKKLLKLKKGLTPKLLSLRLKHKVLASQQNQPKNFRELRHQVGKMRQVWPLRKLMAEFSQKGLLEILPIWLVSPETVSTVFPLIKEMFDLVIFDEASQCPVENGIPSFYRAKQVVVAGDEKQLPPFDLFKVSIQEQDEEEYAEGVADSDSLLNLSKRCYPSKLLAWHYRSKYEELINFSNHAYYGGQVQIAPNVTPNADPPAIEWIPVNGLWENNCNVQEAKQVVSILKQIFINYPEKTVGVITFNSKQQEKIQEYIDLFAEDDAEFNALYSQVMSREIDARLFVKNIENVQGDERDIIIFSIAYGRNLQGRVSANFGTLNLQGGENRLNVAISRGKEKVIIVSSIKPVDIEVSGSKNLGPVLFKQYLRYAYAVANKDRDTVLNVLQEVNQSQQFSNRADSQGLNFDSPFEEEVYKHLSARGYTVDTQIGCSGYRIDLAVIHPDESTRYVLGIECDGAMYHSAKSARERDVYRQRFLESKGWNITRIWSRNWWQNPEKEINRIELLLKELCGREDKSEFQVIQATDDEVGNIELNVISSNVDKREEYPEKLDSKPPQRANKPKEIKTQHRTSQSSKPAEVVKFVAKQQEFSGYKQTAKTHNQGVKIVSFGDRVTIEDSVIKDTFEVNIEENPYNRHLMKEIEKTLFGREEGSIFSFQGNKYKILMINKSGKRAETLPT